MGSDQSSQSGSKRKGKNPKRSHSAGNDNDNEFRRKTYSNSSPRPSICSDSDIPYVSYTTTRPISEEIPSDWKFKWSEPKPKTREKNMNREKRDNKAKSMGSIVTVKPASEVPTVDRDPLYRRLMDIPPFTPIIRESPGVPWTKNPEITEKIDPTPLLQIAFLYRQRLKRHETVLNAKQNQLGRKVRDTDAQISHIMKLLNSREKAFTAFVESMSRINDLTKSLSSCHYALNKTIESIETLNNMLAVEDRLEPFVWTTG